MARELEEDADYRFNFRDSIFQDISVRDEVTINYICKKLLMQGQPTQSGQLLNSYAKKGEMERSRTSSISRSIHARK